LIFVIAHATYYIVCRITGSAQPGLVNKTVVVVFVVIVIISIILFTHIRVVRSDTNLGLQMTG